MKNSALQRWIKATGTCLLVRVANAGLILVVLKCDYSAHMLVSVVVPIEWPGDKNYG